MVTTLCLLGCLLSPAQAPDRPTGYGRADERLLGPRLAVSQELVYRGTYEEESSGNRVRFTRSYRLENRIFVLETPPTGVNVALLTVLRPRDNRATTPPGVSSDPAIASARLELARVDLQGRVLSDANNSYVAPLDGPPTLECGAFVEVPGSRVAASGVWTVAEPGRPPLTWHSAGNDMVNGNSCVKLVGEQQSENWDKPRADRGAWRRTETVWIAQRLGVAYRVERVVERREPAMREPTHRYAVRYELESSLQYPGQLSEERRQEITRARSFVESVTPLLPTPTRYGPQLDAVLNRISSHIEHSAPTPYRDAIVQLKRQIEAAKRGETPPLAAADEAAESPSVVTQGQAAPDFVASEISTIGSASHRLRNWLGKPVLLVFYHPASPTAQELLRFAREVDTRFAGGVVVVGLSVSDDVRAVRRQQAEVGIAFPLLHGNGLRISYAVETTPKMVLVDATGIVRGSYVGWGGETSGEVLSDLRRWTQRRP
jgi:peroxiredoxin